LLETNTSFYGFDINDEEKIVCNLYTRRSITFPWCATMPRR
jgi:hypothetical protein